MVIAVNVMGNITHSAKINGLVTSLILENALKKPTNEPVGITAAPMHRRKSCALLQSRFDTPVSVIENTRAVLIVNVPKKSESVNINIFFAVFLSINAVYHFLKTFTMLSQFVIIGCGDANEDFRVFKTY